MNLLEAIKDIHALNERLKTFEDKYGMLSKDLYALYQAGELDEDRDILKWVSFYELRLDRERLYNALIQQYVSQLRALYPAQLIQLSPQSTSMVEARL